MIADPLSAALEPTVAPPSARTFGNPSLGKEEFLTLLVAQLKNQDPLSPTNPEEMAAQLAQFSSLEQLIQVNENLQSQDVASSAMAGALNNTAAVGVLGKTVLASGDLVTVTGEGDEIITVGVEGNGGAGTLTLYDENGVSVGSYPVGPVGGGRQEIELSLTGEDFIPGDYRYELTVTDGDQPVTVQTLTRARIDGVRYGPTGPVLVSGGLEIPLASVVEIISE